MTTYPNARRGDIWFVSEDALSSRNDTDRTIRGARPVLIVSADWENFTSPCLTVVPISSSGQRLNGVHDSNVILGSECLERQSAAVVNQLTTIDREHLLRFVGIADSNDLHKVILAICRYLNI